MFYKYDDSLLLWKKDWKKVKIALSVVIVLVISSFILGRFIRFKSLDTYEKTRLRTDANTSLKIAKSSLFARDNGDSDLSGYFNY